MKRKGNISTEMQLDFPLPLIPPRNMPYVVDPQFVEQEATVMHLCAMFYQFTHQEIRIVLQEHDNNFADAFHYLTKTAVWDEEEDSTDDESEEATKIGAGMGGCYQDPLTETMRHGGIGMCLDVPARWDYFTVCVPLEMNLAEFETKFLSEAELSTTTVGIITRDLSLDETDAKRVQPYLNVFDNNGAVHVGSFLSDDSLITVFNTYQKETVDVFLPFLMERWKKFRSPPLRDRNALRDLYVGPIQLRRAEMFKTHIKFQIKKGATPTTSRFCIRVEKINFKLLPFRVKYKQHTCPFLRLSASAKIKAKDMSFEADVDAVITQAATRLKVENVRVSFADLQVRIENSFLSGIFNSVAFATDRVIRDAVERYIVQSLTGEFGP